MRKVVFYFLGLGILIFGFSGCGGFQYSATSNVPNTKVYCGYDINKLKYCYTTPFIRKDSPGLGWSNKYFQGRKKGYFDSKIIKHPVTHDIAKVHFNMVEDNTKELAKQKKELERKKLETKVSTLEKKGDFQALKKLSEENPSSVYYIKNEALRLALTGPMGMKVGDIRKLLNEGKSEVIVISLIKRVKEPYKEFTLKEIDLLLEMGLPDKIVSAMIDVTTELLKDKQRRKEQELLLAEQKKISKQKGGTTIINNTTVNKSNDSGSNAVQDELMKQGTKMLFDKLF